MSQRENPEAYVIPEGLNHPKEILLWTFPEIILAISLFMCFVLMNELLIGLIVMNITLYLLHGAKQSDSARGQFQHFLWRISIASRKDAFYYAPDPAITRFDG